MKMKVNNLCQNLINTILKNLFIIKISKLAPLELAHTKAHSIKMMISANLMLLLILLIWELMSLIHVIILEMEDHKLLLA